MRPAGDGSVRANLVDPASQGAGCRASGGMGHDWRQGGGKGRAVFRARCAHFVLGRRDVIWVERAEVGGIVELVAQAGVIAKALAPGALCENAVV